jgi:hypothetical protein
LYFVNIHIKLIFDGKTLRVADVFMSWQVIYFALTRCGDLELVQMKVQYRAISL